MPRPRVPQASVRFTAPPVFPRDSHDFPTGLRGWALVPWLIEHYSAYPEWLALYLEGGVEMGGLGPEE